MIRRLDRNYTFSPEEVRAAIFYWLANAHDIPVPDKYEDALITWGSDQKVHITWDEKAELTLIVP